MGIAIEVPIFSGKVRYKLLNYDFSINTCILPLSNIIKLKEYNNDERVGVSDERMTWVEIIENGLGECDGIEDCTIEKILRSPEHDHCSILAHPQGYVFWRIVRWKIACPDFAIDDGLVSAQQEDFNKWLNTDWFSDIKNRVNFMSFLRRTLEMDCKNISDVRQMLNVMTEMEFIPQFASVCSQSLTVRRKLTQCIRECNNGNLARNEIREAFNEHALALVADDELELGVSREQELEQALYDAKKETARVRETLEGTQMQLKRAKDEINNMRGDKELVAQLREELKQCRAALEEAEEEKEEEAGQVIQLTNQASRLMSEAKEGKELKKKELPRLENELAKLKEEHEMLKERKQQLAVSSAETINQLRDYLRQYQTIIAEKVSASEEKDEE